MAHSWFWLSNKCQQWKNCFFLNQHIFWTRTQSLLDYRQLLLKGWGINKRYITVLQGPAIAGGPYWSFKDSKWSKQRIKLQIPLSQTAICSRSNWIFELNGSIEISKCRENLMSLRTAIKTWQSKQYEIKSFVLQNEITIQLQKSDRSQLERISNRKNALSQSVIDPCIRKDKYYISRNRHKCTKIYQVWSKISILLCIAKACNKKALAPGPLCPYALTTYLQLNKKKPQIKKWPQCWG